MEKKIKVLSVFGTRPEAIKMAPVIKELQKSNVLESIVCVTAQHRQMLDQVLELFQIKPDFDLNIMKPNQNLWELTSEILLQTKNIFESVKPNLILVHGDTTSALGAALSSFYARIPIGHIEAGLRTFDKYYPFPEEINRVLVDEISDLHFAPTQKALDNLLKSGIDTKKIHLTGNTVIDALFYTIQNYKAEPIIPKLNPNLKTILVTAHRRENFGKPLKNICQALKKLIERNENIQIIFPVHLNPNVHQTVYEILGNLNRVYLIEPLDYAPFAMQMKQAHIILTDSGGVQEEAPSLGKPVLVLREETERPEAIECGTAQLVGYNQKTIIDCTEELLHNEQVYKKLTSIKNPYGDGSASKKIIQAIIQYFN